MHQPRKCQIRQEDCVDETVVLVARQARQPDVSQQRPRVVERRRLDFWPVGLVGQRQERIECGLRIVFLLVQRDGAVVGPDLTGKPGRRRGREDERDESCDTERDRAGQDRRLLLQARDEVRVFSLDEARER